MSLRKILFWMHLAAGVVAGVSVFLMSVTGVALTYERQLADLARRDYRSEAASRGVRPLGSEALLAAVQRQLPDLEPSSITYQADAAAPALLAQGRRERLYGDRYTGEVLGDGSGATSAFFRTMTDWHRWLGREGEGRAWGRALTGACNLAFLFLLLSGAFLWWPRNRSSRALRNAMWFRSGLRGKARDFNWHNAVGFLTAIPLLVIVASGVVISYRWAGDLVYTLTGSDPPSRGPGAPPSRAPDARGPVRSSAVDLTAEVPAATAVDLDALVATATAESPAWRSVTLNLPESPGELVRISIDRSPGGQPAERFDLVVDPANREIRERSGYADQSAGQKLRVWLRFAHTGEVYGLAGQTIAGVASLGAPVLVWTGLALSWRRFFGAGRNAVTQGMVAPREAWTMSWEDNPGGG
jgi:uncharacterized iron-regulated membrane protein